MNVCSSPVCLLPSCKIFVFVHMRVYGSLYVKKVNGTISNSNPSSNTWAFWICWESLLLQNIFVWLNDALKYNPLFFHSEQKDKGIRLQKVGTIWETSSVSYVASVAKASGAFTALFTCEDCMTWRFLYNNHYWIFWKFQVDWMTWSSYCGFWLPNKVSKHHCLSLTTNEKYWLLE